MMQEEGRQSKLLKEGTQVGRSSLAKQVPKQKKYMTYYTRRMFCERGGKV